MENCIRILKCRVEERVGRRLVTPTDFNFFLLKLEEETGEKLGISTVKRLWSYVKSNHTPSVTTLSVLARYVGYNDWDAFCAALQQGVDIESAFLSEKQIKVDALQEGTLLDLGWSPDRYCRAVYLGNHRFKILEARNCKLREGDVFVGTLFCLGNPFYVTVCRGNEMKAYVGGKEKGLSLLNIIVKKGEKV